MNIVLKLSAPLAAVSLLISPAYGQTITGGGSGLTSIAADNLLGNFTGSLAVPIAGAVANCTGGSSALTYATSTHTFGCLAGLGTGAGLGANTFTDTQTITQATATHSLLKSTGGSNTGADATSALDFAWTLNTTGSPDVFAMRVTDTARGAATTMWNIYGGASGTTSEFKVSNAGNITAAGTVTGTTFNGNVAGGQLLAGASNLIGWSGRGVLTSPAANATQLGNVDTTTATAQTFQTQSVAAGNSNVAGALWTIQASRGTGTGVGGDLVFKVAPAGTTGSAVNATVTAFTISNKGVPVLPGFTVATLPATPQTGSLAYVTDATACTYAAAPTGGGATFCKVVYTGAAWLEG